MKGFITVLIILLLIALAVLAAAVTFKRALQRSGISDIIRMIKKSDEEKHIIPKSVNGMTSVMVPLINRDFPEFNWVEFKHKAENMLTAALQAIDRQDLSGLGDVSEDMHKQISDRIEGNKQNGRHEHYERVKIHQTEISRYEKKGGVCMIVMQSAIESLHYVTEKSRVVQGDERNKEQTRFNTEIIYVQDAEKMAGGTAMGVHCPNCGAPVSDLGAKVCAYCGSEVIPVNIRVWVLNRLYEVDYHHN